MTLGTDRCEVCVCYHLVNANDNAVCRLNPPNIPAVVQTRMGQQGVAYIQPPVKPEHWCSHFKRKPD